MREVKFQDIEETAEVVFIQLGNAIGYGHKLNDSAIKVQKKSFALQYDPDAVQTVEQFEQFVSQKNVNYADVQKKFEQTLIFPNWTEAILKVHPKMRVFVNESVASAPKAASVHSVHKAASKKSRPQRNKKGCAAGKVKNSTGRCVKDCNRDSKGRCIKKRTQKACKPGKSRNSKGRCVKDKN